MRGIGGLGEKRVGVGQEMEEDKENVDKWKDHFVSIDREKENREKREYRKKNHQGWEATQAIPPLSLPSC